jgi:hypothetical protein
VCTCAVYSSEKEEHNPSINETINLHKTAKRQDVTDGQSMEEEERAWGNYCCYPLLEELASCDGVCVAAATSAHLHFGAPRALVAACDDLPEATSPLASAMTTTTTQKAHAAMPLSSSSFSSTLSSPSKMSLPLSPFSPLLRKRKQRSAETSATSTHRNTTATISSSWKGNNETAIMNDLEELSLSATRRVSVVVQVRAPESTPSSSPAGLCLFPWVDRDSPTNVVEEEKKTSAESVTDGDLLYAHPQTRDLVVVNPQAFGHVIPSHVTMETARLVAQRSNIDDWARSFRFHQVIWPEKSKESSSESLLNLGRAVVHDVVGAGSISARVIVSMGDVRKSQTLFGHVGQQSVAHVLAAQNVHDMTSHEILSKYGLMGWCAHHILGQLAKHQCCTLSFLEIAEEDVLYDLLATRPFSAEAQKRLKLRYASPTRQTTASSTVSSGPQIDQLTDLPVHSLKELGHTLRRVFAAACHPKRGTPRGHLVATLKVRHHVNQPERATYAQFVDLAHTMDAPNKSTSQQRRDAFCRKSLWALGGVLRGTLLKEAGNETTFSFRESTLTKVLQRTIDHPDSRLVVLADAL